MVIIMLMKYKSNTESQILHIFVDVQSINNLKYNIWTSKNILLDADR